MNKLDRIQAILDEDEEEEEEEETAEWEDITTKVKAVADVNARDKILIHLTHEDIPIGLFDLNGFSSVSCGTRFKVEPYYKSASDHDNGGKITWFKVYKRR